MLRIDHIVAGYSAGSEILKGVKLELKLGEVLGIIGLNGCGKSTLGKCLMGMTPYRSGNVYFQDRDISAMATAELQQLGVKMVMQGGRVFTHMTVWEHLVLNAGGLSARQIRSRLEEMGGTLGLRLFPELPEQQKGGNLSGGQRQLLGLALALFQEPTVLILDELSAGLSPAALAKIMDVLRELKKTGKVSILLIEQNIKMAAELADRLLKMERGVIAQEYLINDKFDTNQLKQLFFN